MKFAQLSNEQFGFNKNHALVMSAVIFAFAIYASPALGFNVKNIFSRDHSDATKLGVVKYEAVRSQVVADLGLTENPDYSKMREQVALLDRGSVSTNVLGEAIGIGAIPNAKDMMLPEMEQDYPLHVIENNGVDAVTIFKQGIATLEVKYGLVELMATLNATDAQIIKDSLPRWKAFISELSQLPVPSSQKESFRARFGFYYSMMKTAEVYAGQINESELSLYLKAMIAFSGKIED